jgi:hypothetical protein
LALSRDELLLACRFLGGGMPGEEDGMERKRVG